MMELSETLYESQLVKLTTDAALLYLQRAGLFPTYDLLSVYSRLQGTDFFHPILVS